MTAFPTWTPAARPGIIPLHPLPFGTILGRSFSSLRQNPRVLLGFALVVQTLGTLVAAVGISAVGVFSFARLASLQPGTEDFETVMAGSIALTLVTTVVLSLAASALGVLVQGVVVNEVAHAVVAEKLTLRGLWARVRPVAWRLIGYTVLVALAAIVLVGVLAAAVVAVAVTAGPWAILPGVLIVLAAIPVSLWLTVKLLLVPAAIVLEGTTVTGGIARSWTLTRGRFWPVLGIVVIISIVFGVLAQVAALPFSFLSTGLTTIFAPTGDPDPSTLIGIVVGAVITQVVTLLIQSIALIVQSTASALVYIDCRMRREGLDLDLLAYVDRRDAGADDLPDPYRENIGRETAPRWLRTAPAAYPGAAAYPAGPPAPGATAAAPGHPGAGMPYPGAPYPGAPGPYPGAPAPYGAGPSAYPSAPPQAGPSGPRPYPPSAPGPDAARAVPQTAPAAPHPSAVSAADDGPTAHDAADAAPADGPSSPEPPEPPAATEWTAPGPR